MASFAIQILQIQIGHETQARKVRVRRLDSERGHSGSMSPVLR